MKTHPFYIDAPDFDENETLSLQLHVLCDTLNQMGYEAYVGASCVKLNGRLWTPRLTPQVQAAHYKAGKVPVTVTGRANTSRDNARDIGVLAHFTPEGRWKNGQEVLEGQISLSIPQAEAGEHCLGLRLPYADPELFRSGEAQPQPGANRPQLVYAEKFRAQGGKLRPEHANATDISPSSRTPLTPQERAWLFQQAQCLYVYEMGAVVTEARLCGCPVVYVSNDVTLATSPQGIWNNDGTCRDFLPAPGSEDAAALQRGVTSFRQRYLELFEHSAQSIDDFAQQAHALADALANSPDHVDKGWAPDVLDTLQEWITDKKDRAQYAEAAKYRRIQSQYKTWLKRSSLREIDAQVYAEHVSQGKLSRPAVIIYSDSEDMESIALTLDSLGQSLWQPAALMVVAPFACPVPPEELGDQFQWIQHNGQALPQGWLATDGMPAWCLLVDAGVTLEPNATIEFALAMQSDQTLLAYCDDDTEAPGGAIPHFKPDLNVEWLRCFNYLGGVVAVDTLLWSQSTSNDRFDGTYRLALRLAANTGKHGIAHADTVLAHLPANQNANALEQREAREFDHVRKSLQELGLPAQLQAGASWGNWSIEYLPSQEQKVSVVIPTGLQLGYLSCLLASFKEYGDPAIAEILLVTNEDQREDVQVVVAQIEPGILVRLVVVESSDEGYNHSAALNAGAREATSDLILFMDDDTECLQRHWLRTLRAYFAQSDIACVAPRLVLQMQKDATLQGGPLMAGADGMFRPYLGERALLEERGVFSRLQTSQDVLAVPGHCFVTRRQTWLDLGGFDEQTFNLYHGVTDFCLRARQRGWRHVWTPVSSVLHHGSKTLNFIQRETEVALSLRDRAVREHELWQERWVAYLGRDGSYSRHLSLHALYEIDTDIVLDWPRERQDRPKVLALPISSGSGQYRLVEPLDALQTAGLARTCVVFPRADRSLREPTVLEIARARPNTLIVQHSIGDHHFRRLRSIRRSCPDIFIVQMVDDLFRDLPTKHHLHNLHQREGELRMREAISLCDRLVVSTQPLADAYSAYCPDVRVMPNCLDEKAWDGLRRPARTEPRARLRVGWAGAMQHLDDLEMIADVVRELANDVDWIFMGMCPDVLRPYVKEFHPFVSYADYPAKLATLDLDIAIAPLQDNRFNESKSNLRLLEYGAMGWPVVCSDVYPFRTGNPPVWRLPNEAQAWVEALRTLIADPERRARMAEEHHQWVRKNHFLMTRAEEWFHAVMRLENDR